MLICVMMAKIRVDLVGVGFSTYSAILSMSALFSLRLIIWMCSFVFNEEKHIIHGIIDILFLSFSCPTVHVRNFFVHTSHNPQPDELELRTNVSICSRVGSIIFDVHENYSKLVISLLSKITNNYSPIYDMIYNFDSITVSPVHLSQSPLAMWLVAKKVGNCFGA